MMGLIRITGLGLLIMLGGCQYFSVTSSQLTALVSTFSSDNNTLPESHWIVQYGGYTSVLQPVNLNGSTIFVNEFDSLSFDGWRILKVSGLDSFIPAWEISDSGGVRSFSVEGMTVETHQCDPWLVDHAAVAVTYKQHCMGETEYINRILVDDQGQITIIEQVVDSSLMLLRLRLNY